MKNVKQLLKSMYIPFGVVAFIWLIYSYDILYANSIGYTYGILPRTPSGFVGILFSPFIHDTSSFSHIISNSAPLFVLLWLTLLIYKKNSFKIILFIWLVSGFWTWLAARYNYHIGASGIIYGLAFFLFFNGLFKQNRQLMGISALVVFLYGSMVWGLFPFDEKISFEGHIFGALSGITMSVYMKNKGPMKDAYNLRVKPEFEEFVDAYNQQLFEEEYWSKKNNNTSVTDDFEIFFEYIENKTKKN